jgi:deoxycytidylate deaminase
VLSTVKTVDDAGIELLLYERVNRNTTCHAEKSFLTDFQKEISKKNHSNKKFNAYLYQNFSPCDSCANEIIEFMDKNKDFDISFKIKFANIYKHYRDQNRKGLSKLYQTDGIDLDLIQGKDGWEEVLALPFLNKLTDAEKGQLRNRTKKRKRKDNEEKGKKIFEEIINPGKPDVSSQSESTDESESTGKAKTPSEAKTQDNSDSSDKGESRSKQNITKYLLLCSIININSH